MGLINGLVEAGVLPDVDYGKNLYFCCEASQVRARTPKKKYRSLELMTIRMDISDAFAVALRKTNRQKERVIMQCFANTFLDYYGAEAFRLTVYGADVEACGDFYDYALLKDTMAKTIEKEE